MKYIKILFLHNLWYNNIKGDIIKKVKLIKTKFETKSRGRGKLLTTVDSKSIIDKTNITGLTPEKN